jgi:hypothetical protein
MSGAIDYPEDEAETGFEEDERECCCEGFFEDEDCDAEYRFGIEHCEFMCPFDRLQASREKEEKRP